MHDCGSEGRCRAVHSTVRSVIIHLCMRRTSRAPPCLFHVPPCKHSNQRERSDRAGLCGRPASRRPANKRARPPKMIRQPLPLRQAANDEKAGCSGPGDGLRQCGIPGTAGFKSQMSSELPTFSHHRLRRRPGLLQGRFRAEQTECEQRTSIFPSQPVPLSVKKSVHRLRRSPSPPAFPWMPPWVS